MIKIGTILKLYKVAQLQYLLPIIFVVSLGLIAGCTESNHSDSNEKFDNLQPHPRLLLTDERIGELKIQVQVDTFSSVYFSHLVSWADSLAEVDLLEREVTGRRMLRISGRLLEKVTVLGMVSVITENNKYSEAAIRQLRRVAEFEDWNPSHFLDTAEMTAGVALGYDWFYDQLSPEDRSLLSNAILKKGLEPSFQYNEWATRSNNWNSVGHGGMTLGALAVADIDPETSLKVLERAYENVHLVKESYAPDGAYVEGPMYWSYGTIYLTKYISALKTALDKDYDLRKIPGFIESADYIHQVVAPSGNYFNYGDNHTERVFLPTLFWFGNHTNRADLTEFNRKLVLDHSADSNVSRPGYIRGGARFAPLSLIWRNYETSKEFHKKPLFWKAAGEMPVALMRTSWENPEASFLGIKGGIGHLSHAQMDVGSFVLEAGGVRWVIDLGHQDYHSLESAGLHIWNYRQDSDRWKVFRLGSESHNIPRFGDEMQISTGFSKINKIEDSNAIGKVKIDLSEVYSGQAEQIIRYAKLNNNGSISIRDNWISISDSTLDYSWQMLTRAYVVKTDEGFDLTQDGKTMNVKVESSSGSYKIITEEVDKLLNDFDEPNPGVTRIRVLVESSSNEYENDLILEFNLIEED